jgi:hypothetical protein
MRIRPAQKRWDNLFFSLNGLKMQVHFEVLGSGFKDSEVLVSPF